MAKKKIKKIPKVKTLTPKSKGKVQKFLVLKPS